MDLDLEPIAAIFVAEGYGRLALVYERDAAWCAMAEWGQEYDDSPMVSGVAYGMADTAEGALAAMIDDMAPR